MTRIIHSPIADRAEVETGDLLFCRGKFLLSKAIRFGQFLDLLWRGYGIKKAREFSRVNHVAPVLSDSGKLAEALSPGVVNTHISRYDDTEYWVVRLHTHPHDKAQMVRFADSVVAAKKPYGYVQIAGISLAILTRIPLRVGWAGTRICSVFGAEFRARAGDVFPEPPPDLWPHEMLMFYQEAAPE